MLRHGTTGVWFIGARGSVATTSMVGIAALSDDRSDRTGLVTALPIFDTVALPAFGELIAGGHELTSTPLVKRAEALVDAGVLPRDGLPAATIAWLELTERNLRPGIDPAAGEPPAVTVERLRRDLVEFRERNALETVVVVNVASTEAPAPTAPATASLTALRAALDANEEVLPPSSLYALAAFEAGCAWVDFTPSTGASLPALAELAEARGVVYAGKDGKTGETLLKSALAPMFASRNLHVLAWAGTNLLGGGDGGSLNEPARRHSKLVSKNVGMHAILGYEPAGPTHIDNVAAMGEWKTAWDNIEFSGFLGNRMRMQFTWQGCDSALAAPLVIDLARLTAAAQKAGLRGGLPQLAFFFKDPLGTSEHALDAQFRTLCEWAASLPRA